MSHFSVLVNLGPISTDDIQTKLKEVMQPYHEFECTGVYDQYVKDIDVTEEIRNDHKEYRGESSFDEYVSKNYGGREPYNLIEKDQDGKITKVIRRTNPNNKWDYFVVGGRWSDFLYLGDYHWGNYAKKKDIAFREAEDIATVKMTTKYNCIAEKLGSSVNDFRSWKSIIEEFRDDVDYARTLYSNQSAVRILHKEDIYFGLEDYCLPIGEFLKRTVPREFVTFAYIPKDGEWHERGDMGWWGMISDEKDPDEWNKAFLDFISNSDNDDVLVVVDCHI